MNLREFFHLLFPLENSYLIFESVENICGQSDRRPRSKLKYLTKYIRQGNNWNSKERNGKETEQETAIGLKGRYWNSILEHQD